MNKKYLGIEYQDSLVNCCGVAEVGGFYVMDGQEFGTDYDDKVRKSGTGFVVATFNELQKEEYELFVKQVKVLYQSPPKRNNHGGRRVFVVVAQNKPERKKKKESSNGILPF